jgi:DNA polymerase-3 subunit delta
MTPAELLTELEGGLLRPAYLIAGEEPLQRDDALAALRQRVLDDGPGDFNFDRLEGPATASGELMDAIRALPVLAERRFVLLREPEGKSAKAKALMESLPAAIAAAVDGASTVLVVVAAKVDKRSRWVKAFRDPAGFVACDAPKPGREVVAFAREEAGRLGITLGRGAAEALSEAVGPQLLLLRHELEKARLLAGDGPVTREHVLATVSQVAEEPIWDLTDAIGEGRTGEALAVLGRLLGSGAPPPVLLGSLIGHFRKLLRARHGGQLAGHPFAVRKWEAQARRYTPGRLRSCLTALHDVDEILKGQGGLPADLALERLVLGLSA